jgi:FMN-dependent NADH-azoreductase
MKEKIVMFVCNALGVSRYKDQVIGDYLAARDLANELPQLDIETLKALFRYSGQELRRR